MQRYILTRVVQAILTLLILSLAVFLSVHATGNTADFLLGPETTEADYEQRQVCGPAVAAGSYPGRSPQSYTRIGSVKGPTEE